MNMWVQHGNWTSPVKVGIAITPPFVKECVINDPTRCRNPGINFELFDSLMRQLQIRYTLVQTLETSSWNENGNWHGIMGMLQRGEVDMGATMLSVKSDRLNVVDFTTPVTYARYAYAIKKPVFVDQSMFPMFLFDPISPGAFLALGALLWIVAFLATVGTLMFAREKKLGPILKQFEDQVLKAYRSLVNQTDVCTELNSVRLVFSSWQGGIFFTVALYSGILISVMIQQKSAPLPFTGLNDLATLVYEKKIILLTDNIAFMRNIDVSNATDAADWKSLAPLQRIKAAEAWNPPRVVSGNVNIIRYLLNNPYATYWGSEYRLKELVADQCELMIVEDSFAMPFFLSFPVQKRSPLYPLLESAILGNGSSINDYVNHLYTRYGTPRHCEPQTTTESLRASSIPLDMGQMQGAFWVLVWGLINAFFAALMEMVAMLIISKAKAKRRKLSITINYLGE